MFEKVFEKYFWELQGGVPLRSSGQRGGVSRARRGSEVCAKKRGARLISEARELADAQTRSGFSEI
ncbi:MAG: hypothetical protein FWB75_03030, partial [Oscillospiraceae bacterium]|nr:hypothetical protein [Oscillospiraceae bacterium]